MRALTWLGPNHLQVETVDEPSILNPRDVIIKVTLSSVCGSDLHLLGGYVPTMQVGDIIGHEFLGEVVEAGSAVVGFSKGDRVITISIIGCGECEHCQRSECSCCDNSNPNPSATDVAYGQPCCGIIGYSHAFGGYAGSHATYIRVPFADVNLFKVPESVTDEQAVFVSVAAPTGYFAADQAGIQPGRGYGRRMGLRRGGPDGDQQCLATGGGPSHRYRQGGGAPAPGASESPRRSHQQLNH